jgi:hypothetical protein
MCESALKEVTGRSTVFMLNDGTRRLNKPIKDNTNLSYLSTSAVNKHCFHVDRLHLPAEHNTHIPSPCFRPSYYNAPYQFTALLNLRSLILGLTPYGCPHSNALNGNF